MFIPIHVIAFLSRSLAMFSLAASLSGTSLSAAPPALDESGCRKLSPLPAPGIHPRVFFTAEEIPRIRERYENSRFGAAFKPDVERIVRSADKEWKGLAALPAGKVSDEDIVRYFRSDEQRNGRWGVASLYAVMMRDEKLESLMAKVITNYSRVILASKERWDAGGIEVDTDRKLGKSLKIWNSGAFGVETSWTLGGAGLALSYDVLYNKMTEGQRNTVRKAIATGTAGRRSYGAGLPRGFATSNHYGYHGDLAVMLCAIEGEEGYDKTTYDIIKRVLRDYWEVGFTEKGACHEDGYGPNLGMRAGCRGFVALARRGYNIFETEKYRRFIDWLALEYEPFPEGKFIGGASGGPYAALYQTSTLVSRYMYPEGKAANYAFRHMFGDDYGRAIKWQGWLDCLIYGGDYVGQEKSRAEMLRESGLKLSVFYPERGKLISRSDWSTDALQFTFDARPDAFLIGHDSVDRGNFVLSALGRMWAFSGDFRDWRSSQQHSLVHIDGKAQAYKAPSVKFLWQEINDKATVGTADLKYAYDWEWTPPWPEMEGKYGNEWQKETADPRDLGWPREMAPDWLPEQIYGSDTGYSHPNGMRKRAYNPVLQAIRTTIAMQGETPYVFIADDIQKDAAPHSYQWYMQIPVDLELESHGGANVVLADRDGERKLLLMVVRADGADGSNEAAKISCELEHYMVKEDKGTKLHGKRLILSQRSTAPHFRILLYPFRAGDQLPSVRLVDKPGENYEITVGNLNRTLTLEPDPERGLRIGIE